MFIDNKSNIRLQRGCQNFTTKGLAGIGSRRGVRSELQPNSKTPPVLGHWREISKKIIVTSLRGTGATKRVLWALLTFTGSINA